MTRLSGRPKKNPHSHKLWTALRMKQNAKLTRVIATCLLNPVCTLNKPTGQHAKTIKETLGLLLKTYFTNCTERNDDNVGHRSLENSPWLRASTEYYCYQREGLRVNPFKTVNVTFGR